MRAGVDFRRMPKAERQESLESQYYFTCNCKACTMPEYENFMVNYSPFLYVYSKFYITLIHKSLIFLKEKIYCDEMP